MTATVLALPPLPLAASVGGAAAIVAALASGLWRRTGHGVPALLHVGIDRRIVVTGRDGRARAGSIVDDSCVGALLTTIVWRADEDAWWRPSRAIVVLPDTLPPDDFRRLRVVLRYGQPVTGRGTSGVEAG